MGIRIVHEVEADELGIQLCELDADELEAFVRELMASMDRETVRYFCGYVETVHGEYAVAEAGPATASSTEKSG